MSILLCDIDHFKKVNDFHGHAAGDDVLREFGRRLRENIRPTDLACRYGGEEFVVIMPDTNQALRRVGWRAPAPDHFGHHIYDQPWR